jgi:hypothetical protein
VCLIKNKFNNVNLKRQKKKKIFIKDQRK